MKRYTCIIIIAVSISISHASGQTNSHDVSSILSDLFTRILNTNQDPERLRLNDSIQLIIDNYAASDSVFAHRFSNIRFLGQILSPDSKLKIITWNLILREGKNKYFCYIISKGNKGEKNKVYKLTGENKNEDIQTDKKYTDKDWYGALYYSIEPFSKDKVIHYLLLGIDYGDLSYTRKIIEVLTFTPEGGIIFGNDCFIKDKEVSSRVIIEYSSEAVVILRMKNRRCVVFDHLVSISGKKNNRENLGSEYSYDAYALKKGIWYFITNIDVRNKKNMDVKNIKKSVAARNKNRLELEYKK